MMKCSYCGTTILFGGQKDGNLTFCNQKCLEMGVGVRLAEQIPDDLIQERVTMIHQGVCPKCQGKGPVDVHTSHRIWSALILSSWSSRAQISCRSCGVKSKVGDALYCMVLGWWGFPWGLLLTPIQLGRNLIGLFSGPDPSQPSDALKSMVRASLAAQCVAERRGSEQATHSTG